MQSNPIVEQQQAEEQERRRKEAFRYPYHIVCVYLDEESNDFPIIHEVREYCKKNNLTFMNRQYDVDKYEEDMAIRRLPAFHIYHKKYVYETHYYDMDPAYKIQLVIWAYQDREREKEKARQKRKERWDSFVESVQSAFSLERFKKKPALDLEASLHKNRMEMPPPPPKSP